MVHRPQPYVYPNQITDWKNLLLANAADVFSGEQPPDEPAADLKVPRQVAEAARCTAGGDSASGRTPGRRASTESLQFEPAATVVEPKASRVVQGRVTIDARFAAGETYDPAVRVAGFPGREVAPTLAVLAPKVG